MTIDVCSAVSEETTRDQSLRNPRRSLSRCISMSLYPFSRSLSLKVSYVSLPFFTLSLSLAAFLCLSPSPHTLSLSCSFPMSPSLSSHCLSLLQRSYVALPFSTLSLSLAAFLCLSPLIHSLLLCVCKQLTSMAGISLGAGSTDPHTHMQTHKRIHTHTQAHTKGTHTTQTQHPSAP